MKFTLSWLRDHLETSLSVTELAEKLTMLGLEVEEVTPLGLALQNIRVAKILEATQHPNADRLRLCRVDIGAEAPVRVVCGAPNARADLWTAFIAPGVVVPATHTALKAAVIRGEESHGMLASAAELLLEIPELQNDGILDLATLGTNTLTPGQSLRQVLGLDDTLIDVAVTPNRGDCLSVRGLAADLASAGCGTLKPLPSLDLHESPAPSPLPSIDRDPALIEHVPFFSLRPLQGVTAVATPAILQQRLRAIGCGLSSLPVDVANYVMFDLGAPLHVYDATQLTLPMRLRLAKDSHALSGAQEGLPFHGLNGQHYTLPPHVIVVEDQRASRAIAGILGDWEARCQPTSANIMIEAALFHHASIARAGQALGLFSDARARFERKTNPSMVRFARDYAASLIQRATGAQAFPATEVGSTDSAPRHIRLEDRQIDARLGMQIENVAEILTSLGCTVTMVKDHDSSLAWNVVPPPGRHDLIAAEDLIEELLRITGYDRLPAQSLSVVSKPLAEASFSLRAKLTLAGRGLQEALTWSFVSAKQASLWQATCPDLTLVNPISQDLAQMRPSLIPQLLAAVVRNHHRGQKGTALFEVGHTHTSTSLEGQKTMLAMVRSGIINTAHWSQKARNVDFYDIKADVEAVLTALSVPRQDVAFLTTDLPPQLHPGRSARMLHTPSGKTLGWCGELHPKVAAGFDLKDIACLVAECDLTALASCTVPPSLGAFTVSPYPAVERDFAFIVPEITPADAVLSAVKQADAHITQVDLFDVYRGAGIDDGSKSLALRVVLHSHEQTFSDEQLSAIAQRIIARVAHDCQGVLRCV